MTFRRNHLLYFVTVAEEGQITSAAAKLHVAQPALSQSIRLLESEVELQLLERHPRGVTLTPAGRAFLDKARAAVDAESDLARVARSLKHGASSTLTVGYIGLPPELTNPDLIDAFTAVHPEVEIALLELSFPSRPTGAWLANVDAAICSQPADDPEVWALPLRREPRVMLLPRSHPLAEREELCVADVIDETFIGFHPSVDPGWAGMWTLDDYRGDSPANLTTEGSLTAPERFALLAAGSGIAAAPARHASIIASALPTVAAIPLRDAEPKALSLVGRVDRRSRTVKALVAAAQGLAGDDRSQDDVEDPSAAATQNGAGPGRRRAPAPVGGAQEPLRDSQARRGPRTDGARHATTRKRQGNHRSGS
jgi:DNA-binding transcriptional LysR family regulator